MSWRVLLPALLAPCLQDRCSIDTGPWIWPVSPTVVQQGYGQAQDTGPTGTGIHLGLDMKASVGEVVYAPFEGTIEEITQPLPGLGYQARIVLAPADGSSWRARLLHVRGTKWSEGTRVAQGARIGRVAAWPGSPGQEHAHLEVYDPQAVGTGALANPLAFILGRSDGIAPTFHDIVDSTGKSQLGVAFAETLDGSFEPLVTLTPPLPAGELDILVSVTDYFSPGPFLMNTLKPLAPARVSAAIWKLPSPMTAAGPWFSFTEVYSNSIDLRNAVSTAAPIYRRNVNSTPPTLADQLFVLTHDTATVGWWEATPGSYTLLVTAEDLAGNATFLRRWFSVQ